MVSNIPIEVWLLAVFVGTPVGVGIAAGYLGRRRARGGWIIGLSSIGVALLWPLGLFMASVLLSSPCEPRLPVIRVMDPRCY